MTGENLFSPLEMRILYTRHPNHNIQSHKIQENF
jgi:hypothetical protein